MNTIYLHGELGEEFGREFRLDVRSVREAFMALGAQIEDFEERVREGAFRIIRTRNDDQTEVDENLLDLGMSETRVDVYPAMAGAKSGLGKIVLGIAIIGLAVVTSGASLAGTMSAFGTSLGAGIGFMGITYGGIAAFGVMMALGGISMMFAPSPKGVKAEQADQKSSFIISSPQNTQAQGGPIPLVYGYVLTGSIVASSELTIDQLLQSGSSYDVDNVWDGQGFPFYPFVQAILS